MLLEQGSGRLVPTLFERVLHDLLKQSALHVNGQLSPPYPFLDCLETVIKQQEISITRVFGSQLCESLNCTVGIQLFLFLNCFCQELHQLTVDHLLKAAIIRKLNRPDQ